MYKESKNNLGYSGYYIYSVQEEIKIALDEFLKGKISMDEYKEIVDMYKFKTE